jgi:hypothetical protein
VTSSWRDSTAVRRWIPGGLTIPEADADALVRYGETLVRDNPEIRAVAAEADFPPRGPAAITANPHLKAQGSISAHRQL